jgi:hypothetical protein
MRLDNFLEEIKRWNAENIKTILRTFAENIVALAEKKMIQSVTG